LKKVVTKASKRYPFTRVKQRHGCRLAPDSGTGEAGSIVVVPQDAGRTGRVPGGTLGTPSRHPSSMSCEHEVEAEYLYPSDTDVLDVHEEAGNTIVTLAAPCPNCGTGLALEARVESVEDGDFELPLDDELYD